MNIIEYAENERRTFAEIPFSEVDSLILSTFSYYNFEADPTYFPTWESELTIGEIALRRDPERLRIRTYKAPESESGGLMAALGASPRYAPIRVGFFHEAFSDEQNLQFCAMTFFLPDGSAYLAYRGTDDTIAGWREDFEMSYLDFTPSQGMAFEYANRVAREFDGPLRIGGHSKGGNLAEFAALLLEDGDFKRVMSVDSHEGPGFPSIPSARFGTEGYNRVLRKTVVEQSVLGMLFERRSYVRIVSAEGTGFIQHSPFYWVVSGGAFVYLDALNPVADYVNSFFSAWAATKTAEERSAITEALFSMLEVEGAVTLDDFVNRITKDPVGFIRALTADDSEARRIAKTAFAQLPANAREELDRRIRARIEGRLEAHRERST